MRGPFPDHTGRRLHLDLENAHEDAASGSAPRLLYTIGLDGAAVSDITSQKLAADSPLDSGLRNEPRYLLHRRLVCSVTLPQVDRVGKSPLVGGNIHHRVSLEAKRVLPPGYRMKTVHNSVLSRRFHHWEPERKYVVRSETIKTKIVSKPNLWQLFLAQGAANGLPVYPQRDSHKRLLCRFVPELHFTLIGQITINIEPRRSAVEQQVDPRRAVLVPEDRVPGIKRPMFPCVPQQR